MEVGEHWLLGAKITQDEVTGPLTCGVPASLHHCSVTVCVNTASFQEFAFMSPILESQQLPAWLLVLLYEEFQCPPDPQTKSDRAKGGLCSGLRGCSQKSIPTRVLVGVLPPQVLGSDC